jgi:hypothetical protein
MLLVLSGAAEEEEIEIQGSAEFIDRICLDVCFFWPCWTYNLKFSN